jgi:hypothetical protein
VRRVLFVIAVVVIGAMLPGAGQSRPPESDGSTYTWTGAATLTVDIKPWGGAYVRSDPYMIDCPMGCTRAFDANREVKITAYMTPGHTFKAWEGACAGQGNPCTIRVSGSMDTTAVVEGHYVPPAPLPSATAPVVNPQLSVEVTEGTCPECFHMAFTGTGYNPNSPIDVELEYVTPDAGTFGADDIRTSDAAGAWTLGLVENCEFDSGVYEGNVAINVTATDAQGASASTVVNGTCPVVNGTG